MDLNQQMDARLRRQLGRMALTKPRCQSCPVGAGGCDDRSLPKFRQFALEEPAQNGARRALCPPVFVRRRLTAPARPSWTAAAFFYRGLVRLRRLGSLLLHGEVGHLAEMG